MNELEKLKNVYSSFKKALSKSNLTIEDNLKLPLGLKHGTVINKFFTIELDCNTVKSNSSVLTTLSLQVHSLIIFRMAVDAIE